jgi:dihydroorotase
MAELFEAHNALDCLQGFVSDNARSIYGLLPPDKAVALIKSDWRVPDCYGPVVPFGAGQVVSWQIQET